MIDTTAIVTSIVASAVGVIAVFSLMIAWELRWLRNMRLRSCGARGRSCTKTRIDETNRRTRTDLSNRLQRVETLVDEIGRDIRELRDRTGKLEGTLSTFIQNQGKVERLPARAEAARD